MEPSIFDPSKKENQYRHEFKYLCSLGQLKIIQGRIAGLIPLDPHVGKDGVYNIRSLYFDDFEDRYMMENEAGTDPREKFRIRIYNHSADRISLELKKKSKRKDTEDFLQDHRRAVQDHDGGRDPGTGKRRSGSISEAVPSDENQADAAESDR